MHFTKMAPANCLQDLKVRVADSGAPQLGQCASVYKLKLCK